MVANINPIPDWDDRGLLPPYLGTAGASRSRSPYRVSLTAMVRRFGNTAARRNLLAGLLDFRATLHQAGLTQGFQWVNGSFVTDIMQIANREPRDIDVVTFFHLPNGYTDEADMRDQYPETFDRDRNRYQYHVDSLFVGLESFDVHSLAHLFAYWNSLWSHTREEDTRIVQWKGYLELDLSDREEAVARIELSRAVSAEEATS